MINFVWCWYCMNSFAVTWTYTSLHNTLEWVWNSLSHLFVRFIFAIAVDNPFFYRNYKANKSFQEFLFLFYLQKWLFSLSFLFLWEGIYICHAQMSEVFLDLNKRNEPWKQKLAYNSNIAAVSSKFFCFFMVLPFYCWRYLIIFFWKFFFFLSPTLAYVERTP